MRERTGQAPGEFSNRASARPPERSRAWFPRERTAIGGPAGRSPPVVMRERTGEAPVNSLTARQRGRRSGAGRGAPRANGDRGSGGAKPPGCNEGADGRSPGEFSNRASARPPERSGAWGPRERTAIGGPAGRSPPVVMTDWDAETYHKLSDPQFAWGVRVLAKLRPAWGERILDLGCGSGRLTERLAGQMQHGVVVGLDVSPKMVA